MLGFDDAIERDFLDPFPHSFLVQLLRISVALAALYSGIDFSYSSLQGKISQSTRAHRLMMKALHVGGPKAQSELLRSIFKAYQEDEQDLCDLDMLSDLAEGSGLMSKAEVRFISLSFYGSAVLGQDDALDDGDRCCPARCDRDLAQPTRWCSFATSRRTPFATLLLLSLKLILLCFRCSMGLAGTRLLEVRRAPGGG